MCSALRSAPSLLLFHGLKGMPKVYNTHLSMTINYTRLDSSNTAALLIGMQLLQSTFFKLTEKILPVAVHLVRATPESGQHHPDIQKQYLHSSLQFNCHTGPTRHLHMHSCARVIHRMICQHQPNAEQLAGVHNSTHHALDSIQQPMPQYQTGGG
jgi:hypothetical protein